MMPSLIEPPWRQLLPLIPVANHTETVNAAEWRPFFQRHKLEYYHQAIFERNSSVRLPRSRLLDFIYPTAPQKCLEILLWGYPRPNKFHRNLGPFLQNLSTITQAAATHAEWPEYYNRLHQIGHLGISTITKLAYFYGLTFKGHKALILDNRIITVLIAGRWQPLRDFKCLNYNNAHRHHPGYAEYLEEMIRLSICTGASPDQIEFFLFSWSQNF